MSRMDVREYDNDYSGQKYGRYQPEDKPLSASDITAIAETTVNAMLMRDEGGTGGGVGAGAGGGGPRRDGREDNRRTRYRSRSRSRERRPRSRSRDRSRDKSRGRRSRSRERERSRERSKDRRATSKEQPGNRLEKLKDPRIVTLKGLQSFHKESDIRKRLIEERMRFRDIRVIFNKATQSGTAFVEFQSESEAARWVRYNRGMLKIAGEHLTMDLNKSTAPPKKDWICALCGEKNHYARTTCYSCQSDRSEAPEKPRLRSRSPEEIDTNPSNVLMFRGLDYRTEEDEIREALTKVTTMNIKDIRLIRDKYSGKSRGFAFVEVATVMDGKALMDVIQRLERPLEITKRRISVTFQREPGQSNVAADAAIAAAQWSVSTEEVAAAQQQPPPAAAADEGKQQMPQNIGSYVWDERSGYYYDQSSGLYYDPNTKFYYNPTDGKHYYWNETAGRYDTVEAKKAEEESEKEKAAKVTKAMNAKKIQKDMERWAKAKNRQTAKLKQEVAPAAAPAAAEPDPESMQAGNSIALKIAQDYADPAFQQTHSQPQSAALFSAPKSNTITDDQINRKFEDTSAMACLLCKRKFPSLENLKRHQDLSDLHKTNLATERQKIASDQLGYRDRAAERRADPSKYQRP